MLCGLKTSDDPGVSNAIRRPGLQTRLLAASNAIDRPAYPRCLMARLCVGEVITVAILSLFVYMLLVALP